MSNITFTPHQDTATMTRAEWVEQAIAVVQSEVTPDSRGYRPDPVRVTEEPTGYRDGGATVRIRAEGVGTWDVPWRSTSMDELRAAVRGGGSSAA